MKHVMTVIRFQVMDVTLHVNPRKGGPVKDNHRAALRHVVMVSCPEMKHVMMEGRSREMDARQAVRSSGGGSVKVRLLNVRASVEI